MNISVAVILILVGLLFIIFSRPLARSARNNLGKVLPWDVSSKDFHIEYILTGIVFIVMGLLGAFHVL